MTSQSQKIGRHYEQQACDFLMGQGYEIIARNWCVACVGEIDIIARKQNIPTTHQAMFTLVCVEVKAKIHKTNNGCYGQASHQVTINKQKRLITTMQHFLLEHDDYQKDDVRFDVFAFDVCGQSCQQTWLKNAFLAD